MEMNGIANLLLIVNDAKEDGTMDQKSYDQMKNQLDLMERYLVAVETAHNKNEKVPAWHDVIANRNKYPNRKGEMYEKAS